ncbi:MAG: T9SS type A sorting domain-containing protein [Bacteroidales bacterium]|nr:T9SS type A sorting domain-containing protein [Bacteroidales bacterium]
MNKLFLFIVFSIFSTTISSQDYAVFRLGSTDVSTLSVGDTVYVPVYCDDISDNLILGFELGFSYNDQVIIWNGNPNQQSGITNINPIFTNNPPDWLFNVFNNNFALSWVDPTWMGVSLNSGELLFELVFTYSGGETELVFNYFDLYQNFTFYLIDGCVCNNTISYPAIFHISSNNTILEDAEVIIDSVSIFSDSLGITIFNLIPGDYSFTVKKSGYETQTGLFTLSDSSQIIYVDLDNTANVENITSSDFKIFPNPSNGKFYLKSEIVQITHVEFHVTDLTGRILNRGNFNNISKISFDISRHGRGMYLVHIKSGSMIYSRKVFVK